MPISAPDLLVRLGFSQGKVEIDGPQTLRKSGKIDIEQRKMMDLSFFLDHGAGNAKFPLSPTKGRQEKQNNQSHEKRNNPAIFHLDIHRCRIWRGVFDRGRQRVFRSLLINKPTIQQSNTMIQDITNIGSGAIKPRRKSRKRPGGYILHRGIVNGQRFAAVATMKTDNRKTGDMVQVWFVLEDMHPVEAVARGIDAQTICRGCPFASGRGCYVNVGQAPLAVWRGLQRGIYPELHPFEYAEIFAGRKVRFGAYGNPTLLPIAKVKAIAEASKGWTGYFHDWRENPLAHAYAAFFMASTETEDSRKLAQAVGFRTFHVSPNKPADAIECLSDSKGLSCADCKLCAGLYKGRQPSVWINPHGAKKGRAIAAAMA